MSTIGCNSENIASEWIWKVQEGMEWAIAQFQVSVVTGDPPVATVDVG